MARNKNRSEKKPIQTKKTQLVPLFWNYKIQILVLALFLFSGISGLVYQVVWMRMLKLIFGVTAFAASTVVSAYMAGLSVGSWYFGKRADHSSSPLRLYGYLEVGVGLYALASLFIFKLLDQLYTLIYVAFSPNFAVFSIIRFVVAFIVILIPTVLMGGTLPILIKFFVNKKGHVGRLAGYLYSFNTLGAVIGAFVTGFFLIKLFGVQVTVFIAAAINILAGAGAILIGQFMLISAKPVPESEIVEEQKIADKSEKRVYRLLLWGFGFSGLASLAYEILWTRSLLYFLGLTTYTFTTILTTFLVGIALGSFFASRFVDKVKDHLKLFAIIEVLIGLSALAVIPLIGNMYDISNNLRMSLGYNDWWSNVGVKFLLSFLVMLVPTLLMGATFPIVVKSYNKSIKGIGENVGKIYAANTIGSIAGSFAAGFILIPFAGLRLSIAIVVMINLLVGLTVFLYHPDIKRNNRYIWSAIAILAMVLVAFNTNRDPIVLSSVEFEGSMKRYDLLHYKEGIDASIAVLEDRITGERELNINGESTAFTIYQDMQVHKLLGHLPLLIHPDPQDVLVVGFGFGSTSWASVLYPDVQVDCVELVKDEIDTAPYFEKQNHNVIDHPNYNLIFADGREYIKGTNKKYDVISFNAIHPKISPNLYTLEFYEMCKEILTDDGIIIAWLPPNAITELEYQSLINTFCHVYPHSSLWYVNPSHMLLMATMQPFKIDYARLLERLSIPEVNKDLREVNMEDPYELLSCFLIADDKLYEYGEPAPINSDDLPFIEFSREMSVSVNTEVMTSLGYLKGSAWPYLYNVAKPDTVQENLKRMDDTKSLVSKGQVMAWMGEYDKAHEFYNQALEKSPGNQNTLYLDGLIDRRKGELEKMIQLNPRNARAHQALGEIYMEERNVQSAFQMFNKAVQLDPQYAQPHHHLGVIYYMQNRPDIALRELEQAQQLDPGYGASYFYAGMCYWKMGKLDPAFRNFKKATEVDFNFVPAHFYLAQAYEMKGMVKEAVSELDRALLLDSDYEPARKKRDQLSNR